MSTCFKSLAVLILTGMLAVAALAQNTGGSDQIGSILKLLKHDNPKVRSAAAFTLGSMGKKAAPALEDLILAAGDESKDVQQAVMEAIAKITGGSTAPATTAGSGDGDENKTGNGNYSVPNLAINPQGMEKLMDHHKVWLNAGTTVTITVKSEVDGDVDCYLDDPNGKELAKDTSLSKDCLVTATITQTGYHTIVLDNLGNNINKCKVTYSTAK